MKNSFNIEVNFADTPLQPYEWNRVSFISGMKVLRVSTKCLEDLCTYHGLIESEKKILLLSDTKTSLALKLDEKGRIVKRSFLDYSTDLDVSEFANNLKISELSYSLSKKKLSYKMELEEETKMKEFLIKLINSNKNEEKSRYLYYLYFDEIDDYDKDRLIASIRTDESGRCQKLYRFLIKN